MDLNSASMFVVAVRAGSFTAAAVELDIPLPTLSRRVRQLEEELGVQLVERSARGIKLTEPGARLYEHASRGVECLAEAESAIRLGQSELKGRLRLSIPPTFEPWWQVLSGFQRKYPEIHVSVQVTERRVDLVHDGVDVALRMNEPNDDTVVARRLFTFRHLLVASPALLSRLGTPQDPGELKRFPCATWAANSSTPASWRLGGERIQLAPVLSTNDYAHLRQCAEAGEVLTELPEFLAHPALEAGRLIELMPDFPLPTVPVYLLFLSHRNPSSIVRTYLDYCGLEAERVVRRGS